VGQHDGFLGWVGCGVGRDGGAGDEDVLLESACALGVAITVC
jgi:hypothetical protein